MAALMEARRPREGTLDMAEETFGARLKRLREEAGLTQTTLAEQAGVHKFTVAKLEQNITTPTWPTVQRLAKALGLSCTAFEGTVEPPDDKPPARKGRPRKQRPEASQPEAQAAAQPEPAPEAKQPRRKGK